MSATDYDYVWELGRAVRAAGARPGLRLLLRHSLRKPVALGDLRSVLTTPITAEGRELARRFGETLGLPRPISLLHSPAPRCRQTAEAIAEGVVASGGEAHLAGERPYLGAPFFRDYRGAMERLAGLGLRGFVRAWAAGEVESPLAPPLAEAAGALFRAVRQEAPPPHLEDAVQLHVSHDLTLVVLLSRCHAVAERTFPWPRYLEGTLLHPAADPAAPWRCTYQGQTRPL